MLVTSIPTAHATTARLPSLLPRAASTVRGKSDSESATAPSVGTSIPFHVASSSRRLTSSSDIHVVPSPPTHTTTASHSPRPDPSPPPLKSSRLAKPKVSEIVGGGFAILAVIFGFFLWRYLFLRAKRRKSVQQQTEGDGEAAAGARQMAELPRRTDAAGERTGSAPDSPMREGSNLARSVQAPPRRDDTTIPVIAVEDTGSIREVARERTDSTERQKGVPQGAREIQSPPTQIDTTSQAVGQGARNPFDDEDVADLGTDIESQPTPTNTTYTAGDTTESAESTQGTVVPEMETMDRPNSTSDTQSPVVLRLPLLENEVRAIQKQREAFGKIQQERLVEPRVPLSTVGVPAETTGSGDSEDVSAASSRPADLESARRQNELLRQRILELEEQQRLDWEQGLSNHPPPGYNESGLGQ
ncbi:hypothetical protein B0H13DRAFT_2318700 [Mycena leptocephala]|nr:hypothetical protein B0H13DRAFT_2318700 [Mycena leptocephala]